MRSPRAVTVILCGGLLTTALAGCGRSTQWKQADLDRNRLDIALYHGNESARALAGELDSTANVVSATGRLDHYTGGGDMRVVVAYPDSTLMAWEYDTYTCYEFTSPDGHGIEFDETDCPDGLPDPTDEWDWKPQH